MPQLITIAGETIEYYTREEWGSRTNTSRPVDAISDGPEPQGYLHHAGSNDDRPTILAPLTVAQEMQKMREWQAYCIDRANQGWGDIPYNIGVFPFSGRVYEARGWRFKSGATAGQNEESKAVCMLGNNVPTAKGFPEAINSAILVFVWGVTLHELINPPKILGHWENPKYYRGTTCPGSVNMDVVRASFATKLDRHYNPPLPIPVPEPTPIPIPPAGDDMESVLVIPPNSNARFFGLRDKVTGYMFAIGWIDSEAKYKNMQRFYREVTIEEGATKNILLIGPVPRGDSLRSWSWSDFLNAPPS